MCIIISAKAGYGFGRVCLFVRLYICLSVSTIIKKNGFVWNF